jgi:aminoglycoside phosphotransferase (APT) family kinase protein
MFPYAFSTPDPVRSAPVTQPHTETPEIDASLVRRLLEAQFPQFADRPLVPAIPQGWDNRTFRLGEDMSVRLPSAEGYVLQVEKEMRWLPVLAPHLPLPIPVPLAMGTPSDLFPWPWSVRRWIDGTTARTENIRDLNAFAATLGMFLTVLQSVDAKNGPPAGSHSCFRGRPLGTYDTETRRAIHVLQDEVDARLATTVWETALNATWHGPEVWFHGDVAVNNLLMQDGHLSAVIDFGCSGVGDPAYDTVMAWTLFSGESRQVFRAALPVDEATWVRGRGWALWKALITVAECNNPSSAKASEAKRIITEILEDHERGS